MNYKRGFTQLKAYLEQQTPDSLQEFYTLEDRFKNNEKSERIFGSSENTRNERSQIIYSLNQLAYDHCGKSFNELCEKRDQTQQPPDNPQARSNQSSGGWQQRQISITLQNKIIDFLIALPSIHGSSGQQAFIFGAGLDQALQGHINFGRPPAQFFKLLVQTLSDYELLRDGRDALEAVLESAKGYVGTNKRSYCDTLIRELRKERQESPQTQEQAADRQESSKENTVQNSENLLVDFAFITALEKEAKALVRRFENYHTEYFGEHDIRTYHCGTIPVPQNERAYRVVAVLLPKMGEIAAANAVTDTIARWKPKFLIMIGIAGGIPQDDLDLGDVVVADQIIGYEYGKLTDEEFKHRDRAYPASTLLLERIRNFWDDSWNRHVNEPRPDNAKRATSKHFVGPIASGNKVIASTEFRNQLKSRWSELIALEMEGEGVFAAAFDRPQEQIPATLIIRGISDMADERKSDEWQEYAANAAAAFTINFLKSGPVEPRT